MTGWRNTIKTDQVAQQAMSGQLRLPDISYRLMCQTMTQIGEQSSMLSQRR